MLNGARLQTHYDVIVAGAGPTGICAAIAAGRSGARTLLVERFPFPGGEAVTALNLHGWYDNSEEHIVRGIPWEIILRLKEMHAAAESRFTDPQNPDRQLRHVRDVSIDREAFIYVVLEMLSEANVDTLFHTFVSDVVMNDDAVCGLALTNKAGTELVLGKVLVDATGDADVAAAAGVSFEKGRDLDGTMQPVSMMSTFGGVDLERAVGYFNFRRAEVIEANDAEYSRYMHFTLPLDEWMDDIKRCFPEIAPFSRFTGNAFRKGMVNGTTTTHIAHIDATNPDDLSRAEVLGRKIAFRLAAFMRERVPGFEHCYLLRTSPHVGVRETRRVLGDYYLTYDDVISGRRFDDVVVLGGFFVDIHNYEGTSPGYEPEGGVYIKDQGSYDIPFRCFLPRGIERLLVVGRCLSASHEAHASARVMGTCMGMGHAAGTAAAMAVQNGVTPRSLDIQTLQRTLLSQGAYLGSRDLSLSAPERREELPIPS
jgi:hypothetical protein